MSPVVQAIAVANVAAFQVTPWDALSTALKGQARAWFINRAQEKGIDWIGKSQYYKERMPELEKNRELLEADLEYPTYYTRPFHGYDDGNLNWQAAWENDGATVSMSSGYFSDVDPVEGAARMRNTFTSNVEDFARRHGSRPLKELVDLGCSTGISTIETVSRIPSLEKAIGVDLSPHFLAVADHNAKTKDMPIKFVHGNAEKIDRPLSADLVTMAFVAHELPAVATTASMREAYRTLRPGGVVAVLDLDPERLKKSLTGWRKWSFEATEPHIFEYYSLSMKETLEEAGFDAVEVHPNDPYNHAWIGLKPTRPPHSAFDTPPAGFDI